MHGLECDDVPAIRLYRGSLLSRFAKRPSAGDPRRNKMLTEGCRAARSGSIIS